MAFDPWEAARTQYMKDLSEKEQKLFETATLYNLLDSATAAQKEHEEKSHSRYVSKKLEPLVSAVSQYGTTLDIYANTYSIAMAPLWGSIRVLLHIAQSFEKYFEKLISMLGRIGDVLPRCQVYQNLFSTNKRLLQVISVAYVDIIHFCWTAKKAFRKMKKSTTSTALHLTLKLCWKDVNKEFEEKLEVFRSHVKSVEKEAGMSSMIEAHEGWAVAESERKLKRRDQLLSCLSEIRYTSKHQSERNKRHPGTGHWLAKTVEFKDWEAGTRSHCLWCYGIPGSGKTVLMSSIIDILAENLLRRDITLPSVSCQDLVNEKITHVNSAIIYHYCEFSDPRSLEPTVILGTLIRQLFETVAIPEDLYLLAEQCFVPRTRQATPEELFAVLNGALPQFSQITILIDGLDECSRNDMHLILSMFDQLLQQDLDRPAPKVIIFSRHTDAIKRSLPSCSSLEVSMDKISLDINSFIEETVRSKISYGDLEVSDASLEREIIATLKEGAHGMFLWVHFQLLELCDAVTDFEVRETLWNLPQGMIATYTRILEKIARKKSQKDLSQQVFKWIVCAKRPMSLAELAEAVAFKSTDTFWSQDKIPKPGRLYEACGNLVAVNKEDETVRLAHHTVQKFLLEPPQRAVEFFHIPLPQADREVGEICVAYLSFSDFETQIAVSNRKILPVGSIPEPMSIGKQVTSQSRLNNVASSMFQVQNCFRSRTPLLQPMDFDFSRFAKLRMPPSQTLHEKYRLLGYVVQSWIGHTSAFSESNTSKWGSFKKLALDKGLPFDIRPWADINELGKKPYAAFVQWAVSANHLPLLQLLPQNCYIAEELLLQAIRNGEK
ncbi:hypothetical protein MMC22_007548 [Lobaria immixta]|nr:hypothetical protein [Lobaria immixta]